MDVEKILDALKAQQDEYSKTVWQTMGVIMIALGWIISTTQSRTYLHNEDLVRNGAITVILIMAGMHFLSLTKLYKASSIIMQSCEFSDSLTRSIASSYEIKFIYVLASCVINGALFALLAITLMHVGQS